MLDTRENIEKKLMDANVGSTQIITDFEEDLGMKNLAQIFKGITGAS